MVAFKIAATFTTTPPEFSIELHWLTQLNLNFILYIFAFLKTKAGMNRLDFPLTVFSTNLLVKNQSKTLGHMLLDKQEGIRLDYKSGFYRKHIFLPLSDPKAG